jgi:hypothetical protein
MLQAGIGPDDVYEFYRVAQAIGRRVVLDWIRTDRRRQTVAERRAVELSDLANELAREEAEEVNEFDRLEWRLALEQATDHPRLKPGQRRAAQLLLRGGPYSVAERKVLSRAKDSLGDVFKGLFAGATLRWSRLRQRLHTPAPVAAPLAAAVATATLIGVFPMSGAIPDRPPSLGSPPRVAVGTLARTAGDAAGVVRPDPPAPHRLRVEPVRAATPTDTTRRASAVRAKAALPGRGSGTAEAGLGVVPHDEHWASVPIECRGTVIGAACTVASLVPSPPTP